MLLMFLLVLVVLVIPPLRAVFFYTLGFGLQVSLIFGVWAAIFAFKNGGA